MVGLTTKRLSLQLLSTVRIINIMLINGDNTSMAVIINLLLLKSLNWKEQTFQKIKSKPFKHT